MSNIDISASVAITPDTWSEFKKYFNGIYKRGCLQYVLISEGYFLYIPDGDTVIQYFLWFSGTNKPGMNQTQNDEDVSDFETNYKSSSNKTCKTNAVLQDWMDLRDARMLEKEIDLTTTNGESITKKTINFPYKVTLLCGRALVYWAQHSQNDKIYVYAYPPNNGIIGVVSQAANQDDTEIYVSDTVLENVIPGDYLLFASDTTKYEVSERLTGKVKLRTGISNPLLQDDSVKLCIPRAEGIRLLPNKIQYFGDKSFGGATLPENWNIEIEYHHENTPSTSWGFSFVLVYYHGE